MAIDTHLTQSPKTHWCKITDWIYGLLPTETKKLLLKIVQSSSPSSSVRLGMINENCKREIKPIDCWGKKGVLKCNIINEILKLLYP